MKGLEIISCGGVARTPNSVVDKVHMIDKATSPPASKVNKFDACPPLTDPKSRIPVMRCGGKDNSVAIK